MADTAAAPIMLRVAITRDEWTNLRKLALDMNTSAAELVALAIRSTYNLSEDE